MSAKSATSLSSHHLRSQSNRSKRNNLHTIQEKVDQHNPDQPRGRVNGAKDGDLRDNLNNNRRARDARDYIDQCHREHEERELRCRAEYDRKYTP